MALLKAQIGDQEILVRVIENTGEPGPQDVAFRVPDLKEALKSIGSASHALHEAFKSMAPTELELEFGIDFSLEQGVLLSAIVDVSGNCAVRVTARWTAGTEQ